MLFTISKEIALIKHKTLNSFNTILGGGSKETFQPIVREKFLITVLPKMGRLVMCQQGLGLMKGNFCTGCEFKGAEL